MGQESWSEWLHVRLTAEKYLDEKLSLHAFDRFWVFCKSIKAPEEVFELIKTVQSDFSHDRMLVIAMNSLRRTWLHKLLQLPEFAAHISRETMLELLKELSCNKAAKVTADVPEPSRMYITYGPKIHHIVEVCETHRAIVLEDMTNRMPHDLGCYACNENDEMGVAGTTCELHTVRWTLHESR